MPYILVMMNKCKNKFITATIFYCFLIAKEGRHSVKLNAGLLLPVNLLSEPVL